MKDCGQGCCGEKCTIRNCSCIQNWILTFCIIVGMALLVGLVWHIISPAEQVVVYRYEHEYVIGKNGDIFPDRELVPVEPCVCGCNKSGNCPCSHDPDFVTTLPPDEPPGSPEPKKAEGKPQTPKPKPDCPKQ